jgi:hypothetical protein
LCETEVPHFAPTSYKMVATFMWLLNFDVIANETSNFIERVNEEIEDEIIYDLKDFKNLR